MSFGASPSDIIIVVTFCRALYRKCRDAGGEYDEISREVRGLHTVLKHLKYEVEAPESPLNRDHSLWGRQLAPIIGDCDFTLRQLDELLQKYRSLGVGGPSPTSSRGLWDRVRFGSKEMDTLGEIRVKMISHKTSLTLFLDTIQLHQSGKMSEKLDCHKGQLDVILDKVDNIAARMGHREGSIMTSYDNDDTAVWKQFRRELVAEGFSSDVLRQHKDVLRAYIREIDQQGLLDEPRTPTPSGVNAERWVESIHSAASDDAPPSFSSLGTGTDDSGAKEMMICEDNMKFPQSMKFDLRRLEMSRDDSMLPKQPEASTPTTEPHTGGNDQTGAVAIPIASQPAPSDEKEVVNNNADSSSCGETDSDHEDPSESAIIRTSDILALTGTLRLQDSDSPSTASFRNSFGLILDDEGRRSMAFRSKKHPEFGSSPSQKSTMPISDPRLGRGSLETSPRPELACNLAPDEHGNEIPPDAKWTKISRNLVSPEVLKQDGKRYEARPDFVAILGILSRAEIESLALRSQTLRASRHHRNFPMQAKKENPPPKPPRPIPVPTQNSTIPLSARPTAHNRSRSSSSSRASSSSSSSGSDSERKHDYRQDRGKRDSQPLEMQEPTSRQGRGLTASPTANSTFQDSFSGSRGPTAPKSTAQQAIFMSGGLRPGTSQSSTSQPQSWSYNYNSSYQQQHLNSQYANTNGLSGNWPPPIQPRNQPYSQRPPTQQPQMQQYAGRKCQDRGSEENWGNRERRTERYKGERRRRHRSRSKGDRGRDDTTTPRSRRWKENMTAAGIGGAAASLFNVLTEAAEVL